MIMTELMLIITAIVKMMMLNNKNLLSILISLELINLCIISLTWQDNWTMTLWLLSMSVIHSVIGFIVLLMTIRHYGNDKNINISF